MKNRNKIGAFVLACLFGLTACNNKEVYSEFRSFDGLFWNKHHPAEFDVHISDASLPYSLSLTIRNSDDYLFQNLWLFVEQTNPDGTTVRDTVNVELADVYGKWHGTGLSLYSYSHPYRANYHFPDTGVYRFQVIQGMRQAVLPGISDVGLTVEKE